MQRVLSALAAVFMLLVSAPGAQAMTVNFVAAEGSGNVQGMGGIDLLVAMLGPAPQIATLSIAVVVDHDPTGCQQEWCGFQSIAYMSTSLPMPWGNAFANECVDMPFCSFGADSTYVPLSNGIASFFWEYQVFSFAPETVKHWKVIVNISGDAIFGTPLPAGMMLLLPALLLLAAPAVLRRRKGAVTAN